MSREIKFRAWVKEVYEDGEFAYGGYMVQSSEIARLVLRSTTNLMLGGTGTGIDYFEQGKLLPGLGSVERLRSDEIELTQYTGLRDKNGVEIYEGDILDHTAETVFFDGRKTGNIDTTYREVKWIGDSWGTKIIKSGVMVVGFESKGLEIPAKCGEVIGNVLENPELLGGGTE